MNICIYYIKVSGILSCNKLIKMIQYPHMWRYHFWPISLQYFHALSNTCGLPNRPHRLLRVSALDFSQVKVKFSFILIRKQAGLSRSQMMNWTNSSQDNEIQIQRRKLHTRSSYWTGSFRHQILACLIQHLFMSIHPKFWTTSFRNSSLALE